MLQESPRSQFLSRVAQTTIETTRSACRRHHDIHRLTLEFGDREPIQGMFVDGNNDNHGCSLFALLVCSCVRCSPWGLVYRKWILWEPRRAQNPMPKVANGRPAGGPHSSCTVYIYRREAHPEGESSPPVSPAFPEHCGVVVVVAKLLSRGLYRQNRKRNRRRWQLTRHA